MHTKHTTVPHKGGRVHEDTTPGSAETLDAFAHHMSGALRIARTSDLFTARFYNNLAEAWGEFINTMPGLGEFQESEEYIALALRASIGRRTEGADDAR